jgi:ribonucleoside-diphosphate reductase alpha chain
MAQCAQMHCETEEHNNDQTIPRGAVRRELPKIRNSKTFKFTVAGTRAYMTVGEYEDGTPGELFVSIAKMGSTLRGVMDAFAVSVSYGLQFGVPLKQYVRNFTNTSFAPVWRNR